MPGPAATINKPRALFGGPVPYPSGDRFGTERPPRATALATLPRHPSGSAGKC